MDAIEALRTIQTLAYIALDNDSDLKPTRDRVDAMRRTLSTDWAADSEISELVGAPRTAIVARRQTLSLAKIGVSAEYAEIDQEAGAPGVDPQSCSSGMIAGLDAKHCRMGKRFPH